MTEIEELRKELETSKAQVLRLEQERDALKTACDSAEQAIHQCPALKEWGPSRVASLGAVPSVRWMRSYSRKNRGSEGFFDRQTLPPPITAG